MNRQIALAWLLGIALGAVAGFAAGGRFGAARSTTGSAMLTEFALADLMRQVGAAEWEIFQDKSYEAFPPLSRNPRAARRIIAQAALPDAEQVDFAARFQRAADAWLTAHGAMLKGQQDASRTVSEAVRGGVRSASLELPQRFYAIDERQGVADFWSIVESGRATVIVSLVEGP